MTNPAQKKIKVLRLDAGAISLVETLLAELDFSKDINYFKRCLDNKDEDRMVFVAEDDGTPCGICVLNFASIYPAFRRLNVPEIQDLNVAQGARRQGIGAGLIAACEAAAQAAGHDMVGIGVGLTSAYGNAQRLYARLGYLPDGAGVYYDGQPVVHGEMRPIDDDLCLMMVKEL